MEIRLAKAMGTCFGVRDAVDMALQGENMGQLTIAGQLVHNPQTVQKLKQNGIDMVTRVDDVDNIHTERVMITAHGTSERSKKTLKDRGFKVEDATCPLVERVHKTIKGMHSRGLFPVVIGQPNHVEVKGIVGDFDDFEIIHDESDIDKLRTRGQPRLGIVSQTTNQAEAVDMLVEKIKALPEIEYVEFLNTVCKPTRDRQKAVKELAEEVDFMIVIGGFNSSNTKKLLNACNDKGIPGKHIEGPQDIDPAWFKGHEIVGVTAGTSTPYDVIEDVHQALLRIAEQKNRAVSGQ